MEEEIQSTLNFLDQQVAKLEKRKAKQPKVLSHMRSQLIEAIGDPEIIDSFQLKHLYVRAFTLPQETVEVQQQHIFQDANLKKFEQMDHDHKEEIKELREEIKKGFKRVWIIIGTLGTTLAGSTFLGVDAATIAEIAIEIIPKLWPL